MGMRQGSTHLLDNWLGESLTHGDDVKVSAGTVAATRLPRNGGDLRLELVRACEVKEKGIG